MSHTAFFDVLGYPEHFLRVLPHEIALAVTYKKSWDDGFAARGWKLNVAIGDPQIIASTRETGLKIKTCVFVHDILDHFLSGFGVSGHRSEAMALIQLSKRTGSDPRPDYEQMIQEDILRGRVNAEPLTAFLPEQLISLLPDDQECNNKAIMSFLKQTLGDDSLQDILVRHFFDLGKAGEPQAASSWEKLGLDRAKQTALGLCLQQLTEKIDSEAQIKGVEMLRGFISISKQQVKFNITQEQTLDSIGNHYVARV